MLGFLRKVLGSVQDPGSPSATLGYDLVPLVQCLLSSLPIEAFSTQNTGHLLSNLT